jgi:hypothetical protein
MSRRIRCRHACLEAPVRFVAWDLGRLRLRGTVRHEVLLVRLVQLVDGKLHLYVISVLFAADDRVCHEPCTRADSGRVGNEGGAAHCSSETVKSRVDSLGQSTKGAMTNPRRACHHSIEATHATMD